MEEKSTASTTKVSELLKCLREGVVPFVNDDTEEEKRNKMHLIQNRRSEFPSKIQTVISQRSDLEPSDFLDEIYKASKALFFGQPYQGPENDHRELHPSEQHPVESHEAKPAFYWWHGLNSDVDTEDQAEILIRLFPTILSEKVKVSPLSSLANCYPIYVLLVCSKALPFIPLFAELGTELGVHRKEERAGLTCFMRNVIVHLVHNNLLRDKRNERPSFETLDAINAQILTRLKDKRLMVVRDIYDLDLVQLLLHRSMLISVIQTQRRLRFLLEWDPSLLRDYGTGGNLLGRHLRRLQECVVHKTSPSRKIRPRDFERFRLLLELGMSHFPKSLGFVFHDESYKLACELFGTQKVTTTIDDELRTTVLQMNNTQDNNNTASNHALRALFLEVATNDKISLDGVYTLFRSDPIALLA